MAAILPPTGILENLDADQLRALTAYGVEQTFNPGQTIIVQGEDQSQLYLLLTGKMNVYAVVNGKEVLLAEVNPGESIGEISIFEPGPASATVKGTTGGQLWRLDVEHLQTFLGDYPDAGVVLLLGLSQLLSRRLRHANEVVKANQIIPGFLSVRAKLRAGVPTSR
jgi:CRP/FNR family transcriptional regulator, cyclic AMP receptor protein